MVNGKCEWLLTVPKAVIFRPYQNCPFVERAVLIRQPDKERYEELATALREKFGAEKVLVADLEGVSRAGTLLDDAVAFVTLNEESAKSFNAPVEKRDGRNRMVSPVVTFGPALARVSYAMVKIIPCVACHAVGHMSTRCPWRTILQRLEFGLRELNVDFIEVGADE